MGIGKWVKKKARQAKNKAKDVAKKGEKAVKDVGREVDKKAEAAKREVERLAREAERFGMGALDEIRDLVKNAKREIDSVADKAKDRAIGEIRDFANDAKREIEGMPRQAETLLTEKLPDALKGCLSELSKASIKPVLKKAAASARSAHRNMAKLADEKPDLIEAINNWERSIEVEANVKLGLSYDNFYTRALEVAGVLDRYANEGIKPRRRDIIGFFRATGPSRVSYGVGAELSLGVQIGASYTETVPLEVFLELADIILEEMGVPE